MGLGLDVGRRTISLVDCVGGRDCRGRPSVGRKTIKKMHMATWMVPSCFLGVVPIVEDRVNWFADTVDVIVPLDWRLPS